MDTLTILLALATVGIPALTKAAVATTRLFGGTGAVGQHTYLRKAWLRKACTLGSLLQIASERTLRIRAKSRRNTLMSSGSIHMHGDVDRQISDGISGRHCR
jgi:hypothetical protein